MELHGVAHDVCHLIEATVVEQLHGMEDAPLHGLQTVLDVGDGAFKNHIARIVKKPALKHAAELMADGVV